MKKLVSMGLVGLCMITLTACGGGSGSTDSNSKKESASTEKVEKVEIKENDEEKGFFIDDTFGINNTVYKITGSEIVNGAGDTRVLAINFDFTNNSEEPKDMLDIIMYVHGTQETDNTVEDLMPGSLPYSETPTDLDNRSDLTHTKIKPGATVQGVKLIQLVNDSPVTVTFSNIGFNEVGKKVYEVQ